MLPWIQVQAVTGESPAKMTVRWPQDKRKTPLVAFGFEALCALMLAT